jgi:uncharacterized protein (TIGR02646 family)
VIRVHRPPEPPPILGERGGPLTAACCRAADAGADIISFDKAVYGHKTVKQALITAQHKKCCYCESRLDPVSAGDIEHFRPKAAVRQSAADPEQRPGYYWLAYTWSNLLFACEICNRSHKRTSFPLADASRRARSHRAALTDEVPLLLDPAADDPDRSLGFRDEVAFSRDVRGEATIEYLGLNRNELCESRADVLAALKALLRIITALVADDHPQRREVFGDAITGVIQMSSDRGKYTAMVRAHLRARLGADLAFPLSPDELHRRVRALSDPAGGSAPH